MTPRRITRAGLLAALLLPGLTAAAGLNDTGITQCADATQNNLFCPQPSFPSQDADAGRDAQTGLTKVGGGSAGFDFTKLDSTGAPLDPGAATWDCVRDNVTGLIWEVKTDDGGLRDKDWTYTWCNNTGGANGGSAGVCDTDSGVGSDACANNARCDTEKFVTDVNALNPKLCGYADWRMPTVEELHGIADYSGVSPAIDAIYFPRTSIWWYWSASPYASNANFAWGVFFGGNDSSLSLPAQKSGNQFVRLVRDRQ